MKGPEEQFLSQVLALARLCGWRTAHFRTSLSKGGRWITAVAGDGKGFFDLVLMRERVLFVETKSDVGRLTPEQRLWIEAAERAGCEVYLWRPSMWDEIVKTLERDP